MDENGFRDRLEASLRGRNLSQVATRSGVGYTTLRKYMAGPTLPGLEALIALAKEANVSVQWLATGEKPGISLSPMLQTMEAAPPQSREEPNMLQVVDRAALEAGAMVMLPQLDIEASAGGGALVDAENVSALVAFSAQWLRDRQITPHAAHLLTARGDSMEPTIRSGDLLIVDTAISEAVDNGIYVLVFGGLLLVKRLFVRRDGSLTISSDNKLGGRDEDVPRHELDQVRIAGRVMWYGRII